jgi:hypothetical protein
MNAQLNIDYSRQARDKGIEQAEKHANQVHDSWSDKAFEFLKSFIVNHKKFLAEDVRYYSAGVIPEPPSQRAWGAVIVRAAKQGLIRRVGYEQVKNAKAHRANASVWAVN